MKPTTISAMLALLDAAFSHSRQDALFGRSFSYYDGMRTMAQFAINQDTGSGSGQYIAMDADCKHHLFDTFGNKIA